MSSRALRVALIQSGRIVEDRTFTGKAKITVGSDPKCTFLVPMANVPTTTPVFELGKHGTRLLFDSQREGRVSLEGTEVELTSLAGRALKKGNQFSLALPDAAKGRMTVGEVSLLFQFVEPPKKPTPAALPKGAKGLVAQLDRSFIVVLGLSLAAHFAGAGWISAQPAVVDPELAMEEQQPDRFARAMLPPKPAVKTEVPTATKNPEAVAAAPTKQPVRDTRPTAAAIKDRVRGMGMLAIIGAKGDGTGALGDLLKNSGVGDITSALRDAKNVTVASVDDARRKGEDQGRTSNIGTIATEGVRNVELDERAVANSNVTGRVESETVEVDTKEIDERALTRWLNARKPAMISCYERELKRRPTLAGRMVIRFAVDTRGHVARVGFDDDTLKSPAVQLCITTVMRAWVLPFSPEDEVPVSLPFIFTAGR